MQDLCSHILNIGGLLLLNFFISTVLANKNMEVKVDGFCAHLANRRVRH